MTSKLDDARLTAAVDMARRTGAAEWQIRYSDDEQPTIWMAAARWGEAWECAAALHPVVAAVRLLEQVIDGGECKHCHRPTGLSDDFTRTLPLDQHVCWYQYDPELGKFRRGCE